MPRKYKRLKYSDRKNIEALIKEGKSGRKIAEAIGVHHMTIAREIERAGGREHYNADAVQESIMEDLLS